jgi:hypothetical protein
MSPIRHQDDFRRVEIEDWDEWVQGEIQQGMENGEFENLPDKGKPIKIWRTEVNPEYDLVFSRLKNAGVLPAWMELDAEVSRKTQALESFLEASREYLDRNLRELREAQHADETEAEPTPPRWQFWRRIAAWWRLDLSKNDAPAGPTTVGDLIVERDRMRQQYIERAAALDKTIVEYHDTLPRELSHLQRLRMLPERAARLFDEHVPIRMLVEEELG